MKEWIRKFIRKMFLWTLGKEMQELRTNLDYIKEIVGDKEASCNVDVHMRSPSWAVVNLHGKNRTYMKFVNLENRDCVEILKYLKQFAVCDVDDNPTSGFMRCELFKY